MLNDIYGGGGERSPKFQVGHNPRKSTVKKALYIVSAYFPNSANGSLYLFSLP